MHPLSDSILVLPPYRPPSSITFLTSASVCGMSSQCGSVPTCHYVLLVYFDRLYCSRLSARPEDTAKSASAESFHATAGHCLEQILFKKSHVILSCPVDVRSVPALSKPALQLCLVKMCSLCFLGMPSPRKPHLYHYASVLTKVQRHLDSGRCLLNWVHVGTSFIRRACKSLSLNSNRLTHSTCLNCSSLLFLRFAEPTFGCRASRHTAAAILALLRLSRFLRPLLRQEAAQKCFIHMSKVLIWLSSVS